MCDAQVRGLAQNSHGSTAVGGRAEDLRASQLHRAIPYAGDRQILGQGERSGGGGWQIVVLCLVQLNRNLESRAGVHGKRPQLADLRMSGRLEMDADMVLFLHRPYVYEPGLLLSHYDQCSSIAIWRAGRASMGSDRSWPICG